MNNRILVTVVFVTIYCVFIRLFVGKYNPSWYQASWISGWPENIHVRLNCSPLLIEVSCIDCTNFGTDSRNKEKLIDVKSYWINDKSLQKKWSFLIRISSGNVTKSTLSCGFDHIYWRNPLWETWFFVHRVTKVYILNFNFSFLCPSVTNDPV